MARWLFKQEPDEYSFADLERDGQALWDGVSNPLARKHLRAARPGDLAFFYETGGRKAVVGVMAVSGSPQPDPDADDDKAVVVPVTPVRRLARPVALAALKADPRFAGWELVRMPRLSVMPVSDEVWGWVEGLAASAAPTGRPDGGQG